MRIILLAIAALSLAACAGSAETAQLDLKDACVFSGPATEQAPQPGGLDEKSPLGFFSVNGQMVPYRITSATLIKHRAAPPACSSHVG